MINRQRGTMSFDLSLAEDIANFELVKAGWKKIIAQFAAGSYASQKTPLTKLDTPTIAIGCAPSVTRNSWPGPIFSHPRILISRSSAKVRSDTRVEDFVPRATQAVRAPSHRNCRFPRRAEERQLHNFGRNVLPHRFDRDFHFQFIAER